MEFTDPNSIIEVGSVKVLLYGPPGIRKTTFAMTANKPLLFDFDNGIRRVNTNYRQPYKVFKAWLDVIDYVTRLTKEQHPFLSFVTDTAGKSLDLLAEHLKATNPKYRMSDGTLSLKGFGALASVWRQGFFNTLLTTGFDLVFVAHHKEEKGQKDELFTRPDITGQTMSNLLREMDLVGYMHIRGGRYAVTFNPSEDYYAKNSANLPDVLYLDEWSLADIIELFRTAVNADSSEYQAYLSQMTTINNMVSSCLNAEGLNAVVQYCGEQTKNKSWVYTALNEAKSLIVMKAQELQIKAVKGVYFDKDAVSPPANETVPPAIDNSSAVKETAIEEPLPEGYTVDPATIGLTVEPLPEQMAVAEQPANQVQTAPPKATSKLKQTPKM